MKILEFFYIPITPLSKYSKLLMELERPCSVLRIEEINNTEKGCKYKET